MMRVKLRADVLAKDRTILSEREKAVIEEIRKKNDKLVSAYDHLRLGLLCKDGIPFDETNKNDPKTMVLDFLFKKEMLEEVGAEKPQKKRLYGAAASNEALLTLKIKLKRMAGEVTALKGAVEKKITEITRAETVYLDKAIPPEKMVHVLNLLKNASHETAAMRAEIVEIRKKERDCRMVRFLLGKTDDAPTPIEASTIISQCYGFYWTVKKMDAESKEKIETLKKHPIDNATLIARTKESKITLMTRRDKPYVLMLETPTGTLDGMIFLEMERAMDEALKLL